MRARAEPVPPPVSTSAGHVERSKRTQTEQREGKQGAVGPGVERSLAHLLARSLGTLEKPDNITVRSRQAAHSGGLTLFSLKVGDVAPRRPSLTCLDEQMSHTSWIINGALALAQSRHKCQSH